MPCLFSMASSLVLCVWRQGHFVWCVVFLQCSEIESHCSEIHIYRPSISYHAALAGRRNKMLELRLATLNASSPTMSHALEKTIAARIGVICLSASSKLSASCLHGYSVSIRKFQGFFSGRRYSQHPRLSRP